MYLNLSKIKVGANLKLFFTNLRNSLFQYLELISIFFYKVNEFIENF